MPKLNKQILKDARQLLADPKHWSKGAYARTQYGLLSIAVSSPKAACFCLIGAIKRVGGTEQSDEVYCLASIIAPTVVLPNAVDVIDFNDATSTTHADVLALLDKAIETC